MPVAESIAVGQELPSIQKEPTQRRIDVYSGVRPRSIHTDPSWAHAKGFRTTLAQGMMSTAYVSEMMTRRLGAGTRVVVEVWCQNQDGEKTAVGTASGLA